MSNEEFARRIGALKPVLFRVCRTQLARPADREDAVQEAILRAWERLDTLREPRYFETWLIRILINECHNVQRRGKRLVLAEVPPEPEPPREDRSHELTDALAALDEGMRLCVELHYIEGYSVKEVSAMLGIGESAVKLRLHRGRKKLRALLSEEVFGE